MLLAAETNPRVCNLPIWAKVAVYPRLSGIFIDLAACFKLPVEKCFQLVSIQVCDAADRQDNGDKAEESNECDEHIDHVSSAVFVL